MKRILCLFCAVLLLAGLLGACEKSILSPENTSMPAGAFNAAWPENEFTEQVPKPVFETALGVPSEMEFTVLCVATIDQLREYVKGLKKAGFKRNDTITDEIVLGMTVFNYTASNNKGYAVEVNYTNTLGGMSTLIIKKTD